LSCGGPIFQDVFYISASASAIASPVRVGFTCSLFISINPAATSFEGFHLSHQEDHNDIAPKN